MDDYNSDLEDFGPRPTMSKRKLYRNFGAASIVKLLDNALEDRFATKKSSKHLELTRASNPIRGGTKKAIDVLPNSPFYLPRVTLYLYNWDCPLVQHRVIHVIEAATFHEKGFTLTKQEHSRIASVMQQLIQNGTVTNNTKHTKEWVGVTLVSRLVAALFEQALEKGTLNWDCTIQKALCVILMSAIACRSGDITRDHNDTHSDPYLMWQDIEITMSPGGKEVEDLEATVMLRNEKFDKMTDQRNRTVFFKSLQDPSHNVMCPVKLLLIHALRTGAFEQTDIKPLVDCVMARESKRVIRKHPKRPVLAKFSNKGASLMLDEPATNHHIIGVVHAVAKTAGFLRYIHPHDLRRGAARDLAHLPAASMKGVNVQAVGQALGHSLTVGATILDYVRDDDTDTWTARVERPYQARMNKMPIAPQGYKAAKIARSMCTAWCEQQGLDPNIAKNLEKARSEIEQRNHREWMASGLEERDRPRIETPVPVPQTAQSVHHYDQSPQNVAASQAPNTARTTHIPRGSAGRHHRPPLTGIQQPKTQVPTRSLRRKRDVNYEDVLEEAGDYEEPRRRTRQKRTMIESDYEDDAQSESDIQSEDDEQSAIEDAPRVQNVIEDTNTVHDNVEGQDPFNEQAPLDNEQTANTEALLNTMRRDTEATEEEADMLLESVVNIQELEESSDTPFSQISTMKGETFVHRFATINLFSYHGKRLAAGDERMKVLQGNGKDTPMQFRHRYKNSEFGCNLNFPTFYELEKHELTCKAHKSPPRTEKNHKCPRCGVSFVSDKNMKAHIRLIHDWEPQPCKNKDCSPTVLYATHKEWRLHKQNEHLNQRLKCPVDGCKSETEFRQPNYLKKHIIGTHKGIPEDEVGRLVKAAQGQGRGD